MSKESVLRKLEGEWEALLQSFANLPDEALLQPRAAGDWSVRDVLGHISTWDREALLNLPLILQGQKTPLYSALYGGIDAYNAQEQKKQQDRSLVQIRQQLKKSHADLVEFLAKAPEENFKSGTRFLHRLKEDTYGHYPEHARAIRDWRERTAR